MTLWGWFLEAALFKAPPEHLTLGRGREPRAANEARLVEKGRRPFVQSSLSKHPLSSSWRPSWAGSPSSGGSPADKEYECGARGDKDAKFKANRAVAEVLEAEEVLSVMIQQETSA